MRGFLGGVSMGAVVAASGAVVLSLSTPLVTPLSTPLSTSQPSQPAPTAPAPAAAETQPLLDRQEEGQASEAGPTADPAANAPEPPAQEVAQPDASAGALSDPEATAPGPDPDLAEAQPIGPEASPAREATTEGAIDTASADRPDVATNGGITPDAPGQANAPAPAAAELNTAEEAATPAPEAANLTDAPSPEASPEVATESAALIETPAPETGAEASAPALPAAPDAAKTPELALQTEGEPPSVPQAPEAPNVDPAATAKPEDTELPTSEASRSAPATAPQLNLELATPQDEATPTQPFAGLPQATDDSDGSAANGPTIGTRVVPLTERDDTGSTATEAPQAIALPDRPFDLFAADTPPLDHRPLMSIVLLETEGTVGAEALSQFPYPLTFAIDPNLPDAQARMEARRRDGFEVMILADLPREAAPQDVESAMPVWRAALPEAVGLLEGVTTGLQGNRPMADQAAALARDLGYGLVLQNNGLNTVQKLALRDGVPAGVVFRDFDGAGQNPRAIRRFLDQAAFRAGIEGSVIMVGRLKPDTISALLSWGLQDRASRISMVPITASLRLAQE